MDVKKVCDKDCENKHESQIKENVNKVILKSLSSQTLASQNVQTFRTFLREYIYLLGIHTAEMLIYQGSKLGNWK